MTLTLDQLAKLRAYQLAGEPRRRLKRQLRVSLRIKSGCTAAQLDEALALLAGHPEREAIEARAVELLPEICAKLPSRRETEGEAAERRQRETLRRREAVLAARTPLELCQAVGGSGLYDGGESERYTQAVLRWCGEVTAAQAAVMVKEKDLEERDADVLIAAGEAGFWDAECQSALDNCAAAGSEKDEHRYMVYMVYRKSGAIVSETRKYTRYFADRETAEDYFTLLGDNRTSSYRQELHDRGAGGEVEVEDDQ